jgi:hypothetical protein
MSSSVELDIQEITNIANDIAENEEFILSKQKWRSSIDRNRAYDEKDVSGLSLHNIFHWCAYLDRLD